MTAREVTRATAIRHGRFRIALAASLAASVMTGGAAVAAETEASPNKSAYSIFNPTPDSALRAFSPDRPGKAISSITVDAGRWQIESDFLTALLMKQDGATTKTLQALDPVSKLGITDYMDFEVSFDGIIKTRTRDDATGRTLLRGQGFGDVTMTAKFNLVGNEGGKVSFALAPYLTVPSGTHNVTAGQIQGGLIAPLTVSLPSDFSATLQAEIDALANVNGPGTHAAFTNILSVSHPVPGIAHLSATAELYSSITTEAHAADVDTFDLALAYLVGSDTQLDVGANIGLSRGAPDLQLVTGVAHRF